MCEHLFKQKKHLESITVCRWPRLLAAPGLLQAAFACSWAAPGLLLGSFPPSRSNLLPSHNTYASLGSSGGVFVWWYLRDAVSDGSDCILLLVSLLVIWYWEYQLNEEFRPRNGLVLQDRNPVAAGAAWGLCLAQGLYLRQKCCESGRRPSRPVSV